MGLIVKSLDDLPETSDREYFIYLLDYGWHEPIIALTALLNPTNHIAKRMNN